ncbi:MAG: sensor histidine kinase [Bacteroidia bacterium]
MLDIGYPHAKINKKIITFFDGYFCKLPGDYLKVSNRDKLQDFYSHLLLNENKDEMQIGIDPLGFTYIRIGFLCYIGLVVVQGKDGNYGSLKKRHPENKFSREFIVKQIQREYDLLNYKYAIPIELVTQNLHEIRGLNSKIAGHIDNLMGIEDDSGWEEDFDKQDESIKKIFVASRLIKFLLDNTKFYIPDFFKNLMIKHDRELVVHKSVSKIVKIYSNDFKKEKVKIQFTGNSYTTITGEKEYFEILIKILVENALKYSLYPTDFPPKLNLSETTKEIIIEASSYGDLIPDDDRQHLFTKGFRSNINKQKQEGTGMGLYNAQQLAQHFSANISYSNKPAASSTEAANTTGFILGWNIFTLKAKKTRLSSVR